MINFLHLLDYFAVPSCPLFPPSSFSNHSSSLSFYSIIQLYFLLLSNSLSPACMINFLSLLDLIPVPSLFPIDLFLSLLLFLLLHINWTPSQSDTASGSHSHTLSPPFLPSYLFSPRSPSFLYSCRYSLTSVPFRSPPLLLHLPSYPHQLDSSTLFGPRWIPFWHPHFFLLFSYQIGIFFFLSTPYRPGPSS